jgi:hypothetical protein
MKTFYEMMMLVEQEQQASGPKTAEVVAEEFYNYMKVRFPDHHLGVIMDGENNPGSGNCAWTARRFTAWLQVVSKGAPGAYKRGQVVFFPETPRSDDAAHIVPAYDGKIIDYIQAFTGGKKYVMSPLQNSALGEHDLDGSSPYKRWYDKYVVGNEWGDINRWLSQKWGERVKINSYDRPRKVDPNRPLTNAQLGVD